MNEQAEKVAIAYERNVARQLITIKGVIVRGIVVE